MSLIGDMFNNFLALVFFIIGVILIGLSIVSCSCSGMLGSDSSPWVAFLIFFIPGLICIALAKAFAKRG